MRQLLSPHRLWQLLVDGLIVAFSWWVAFQLRFDHGLPPKYSLLFNRTILLVVGIKLIVFIAFGFYNRWWRYVSIRDMWATARGVVVACLIAEVSAWRRLSTRCPLPTSTGSLSRVSRTSGT